MSFIPKRWKPGNTISSAELSRMEQGIAAAGNPGGVRLITGTTDDGVVTYDASLTDIITAMSAGIPVMILETGEDTAAIYPVLEAVGTSGSEAVTIVTGTKIDDEFFDAITDPDDPLTRTLGG